MAVMADGLVREIRDRGELESVRLFHLCAHDSTDFALWTELLRRFTPRIKSFIRGTLRQNTTDSAPFSPSYFYAAGSHESDLFQNTILRLVENDCAAMKRFTGTTEEQLLAYLAVITRSVVRDSVRRDRALKRPALVHASLEDSVSSIPVDADRGRESSASERGILAREVKELSKHTIRNRSDEFTARDLLIFELYFEQDLTTSQIANCQGVELSKTGVEKVLNRLKDRVRSAAEIGTHEASLP
jgi:RNA polymerase sigma factor (sigma-70 family)